ncbi:4'-phosphopantetheinyl transferase family protein [Alteromonas stellipolaris]|uniref:4'-phosphopantetheinyl transferase family protein n=1 Tax=Alteromonas stellipolaris TaxID=233316 RepID=UPI001E053E8B|nr:4'-phosphopantetheinyl transferase superfamily protein [Alteromonas stellipolaris]MBZ2163249.1 4'-phosphopantetheinyl transferase superfamily protein [Alteromonas stellipolaris]
MFSHDISHKFTSYFDTQIKFHFVSFHEQEFDHGLFKSLEIAFPYQLKGAVNKRRAEFIAGRLCAKRCLEKFHLSCQVPIGDSRSPVWPENLYGSISHTSSVAGALVISSSNYLGIGLDIENILLTSLVGQISSQLMTPEEAEFCYSYPLADNLICTLIFSAKESFFKAAFNQVKSYFNFSAVRVVSIKKEFVRLKVQEDLCDTLQAGYETDVNWIEVPSIGILSYNILK